MTDQEFFTLLSIAYAVVVVCSVAYDYSVFAWRGGMQRTEQR